MAPGAFSRSSVMRSVLEKEERPDPRSGSQPPCMPLSEVHHVADALKQHCDCNDPKARPDGHSTQRPKAGRIGTASNARLKRCINHFSTPVGSAVSSAALSFAVAANKHSLEMQRAPTMTGESRRGRCAAPKWKSRRTPRTCRNTCETPSQAG